jgi:hypothetical protein
LLCRGKVIWIAGFVVLIKKGDTQIYEPPVTLSRPGRRGAHSIVKKGDGTGKIGQVAG